MCDGCPRAGRSLTISDLSERTGVPPATLRSWESRYGFPRPRGWPAATGATPSPDVAAVLEVLRHRDSGLALEAAVRRAASESPCTRGPCTPSYRRRHPELRPAGRCQRKTSLLALSRAIEDECCAQAQAPLSLRRLPAREVSPRASQPRWAELARTARATVVFADLGTRPLPLSPAAAPHGRGADGRSRWRCRTRTPYSRDGSSCATPRTCRRAWRRSSAPARRVPGRAPALRDRVDGRPARGPARQPGCASPGRRLPAETERDGGTPSPTTSRRPIVRGPAAGRRPAHPAR